MRLALRRKVREIVQGPDSVCIPDDNKHLLVSVGQEDFVNAATMVKPSLADYQQQ